MFANLHARLGLNDPHRVLGFIFIFTVAFIWVIASFAVQGLESTGVHPVVLTFIANSLFSLYLPIYYLNLRLKQRTHRHHASLPDLQTPTQESSSLFASSLTSTSAHGVGASAAVPVHRNGQTSTPTRDMYPNEQEEEDYQQQLYNNNATTTTNTAVVETPPRQLFKAACVVAPLWFFAQLTFNTSLELTSVTSNTILSSASALFTFLFAVVFLSERFTLIKLASIVALIGGTAMVTLADASQGSSGSGTSSTSSSSSVYGDLLCLLSSIIYGAYTVSIRHMLGEDEGVSMTLFFGFMGGLLFIIIGPLLAVAATLFHAPLGSLTWASFGLVLLKGLLDNVLSDYLWARAILLVGPTLATAGLSMQVPLAIAIDGVVRRPAWLHSAPTAWLTFIGGGVVLTGFFVLTLHSGGSESGSGSGGRGNAVEKSWERHSRQLDAVLGFEEGMDGDEEGVDLVVGEGARLYAVGGSGKSTLAPLPPERQKY